MLIDNGAPNNPALSPGSTAEGTRHSSPDVVIAILSDKIAVDFPKENVRRLCSLLGLFDIMFQLH